MSITTISSREFNQQASEAKKATKNGPVFITDRGRPAHVLISIKDYKELTGTNKKIADLLVMPDFEENDFEIPQLCDLPKPADFL